MRHLKPTIKLILSKLFQKAIIGSQKMYLFSHPIYWFMENLDVILQVAFAPSILLN